MGETNDTDKARPNYIVTIAISDDGSWPRIEAKNLCGYIGIKIPTGLRIKGMSAVEQGKRQSKTSSGNRDQAFDALVAALTELRGRTLEHFRDVHGAHGSKDVATTLDNADAALKLASEGELNR